MKKYITTTLPYVNADPHIGFALEIVQADAWARAQRLAKHDVIFNTGTDEHGQKIYQKAQDEKKETQDYVDEYAAKFDNLKSSLNLSYTNFIRTTDDYHKKAAQEFWKLCAENGDIYKKNYQIKYCVGCELEKTDSELIDNTCPLHPNKDLELINEENYFFRFSNYQNRLLDLYKNSQFVQPNHRLEEIQNFVKSGLNDFSISRLKEKMPWGVPVPNDNSQVMYVWFDALVNYISTLGWPNNIKNFKETWPGIQVAGKDNLRQQSAMWQAMLMSAGIEPSKQIFIHGFINVDGQKMSKSVGNVINPFDLVKEYGTDTVRYYLLREIPSLGDGDFSYDRMNQIYDADLANELGNLLSRVTTLAAKDNIKVQQSNDVTINTILYEQFAFNEIVENIWKKIKEINKHINEIEPWSLTVEERKSYLTYWLKSLYEIGYELQPIMPETAEIIMKATSGKIEKIKPLFPRLNPKT